MNLKEYERIRSAQRQEKLRAQKAAMDRNCSHCGRIFRNEKLRITLCSEECRKVRRLMRYAKYRANHLEKVRLYAKEYYLKKRADSTFMAARNARKRIARKKPEALKKMREYLRRRWQGNVEHRLRVLANSSIVQSLKRNGGRKNSSILSHLPYSIPQLKAHLESFFDNQNGFTWDNQGSVWHIDHVIPQAVFRYSDLDSKAFRDCWALSNLRPAHKDENMSKHCDVGFFDQSGQKRFIT